MEKQTTTLTPEDSLRIISEMIKKTKEEYMNKSFYFLLWGYIISIACILQFAVIKVSVITGNHHLIDMLSGILWGTLIFTGIIIQYINIAKKRNVNEVKTYIGEFMSVQWQVTGTLIIIMGLFCFKLEIYPSPFILAVCGAATFISGKIIKHKILMVCSVFMVLFSVLALWIVNEYQLLITALAIIIGYLLPGYSLKYLKN